jgi:Major Facilitator Superfamily
MPRYLTAAVLARIADEGARVSLVLLALERTGSAAIGGTLVAALLIPHVVAAPLVGVLVDRTRRPQWVLASAMLIFAGSLFSVSALLGRAPLWLIYVLLIAGGCCGPALTGGLTSQLPALVGKDKTPRAFGLDSLVYNVASMVGPAVAGITAATANPTAALSVLAASAAVGALGVASLPFPTRMYTPGLTRPGLLSGAREIVQQPTLRTLTLTTSLGQIGPGGLAVVAAVLATSQHRPAGRGLLLTAVAAGAFIGSLLWTWRPIAVHHAPLVTAISMIGIGMPIAIAAIIPTLEATAVLFGLSGVFIGPFGSALFLSRTQYAAPALRTQVFTIGAGLKVTASALGAALIGFTAGLPIAIQLIIVASSPLLAGALGAVLLTFGASPTKASIE